MLYSEAKNFVTDDSIGITEAELLDGVTDGNASDLFSELDVLSDTRNNVLDMAEKSPGGDESAIPEDSLTTEGSMQKSGLGVVTTAGKFLYSVPKKLIYKVAEFLGIDERFAMVGSMIIILLVSIILVSSVLRNRL